MADTGAGSTTNVESKKMRMLARFWVAAWSSMLVLLLMFALYWQSYLDETGLLISALGILTAIVAFYALIRSGINLKFSDPSLTIPQIISGMVVLLIAMYYTSSSARPVILPVVLMAFVFGVFRLETRKLISVALFVIAGYALIIRLLLYFRPQDVDLALEVLRLSVFGPILLWFAFMGGYISKLRKKLSDSLATMKEMAAHDSLTGLPNRRHLLTVIELEKSRSDRSGEVFCICFLDLDFFKAINDKFGHLAGDQILKASAECGAGNIRTIDCFGRYGGEEFEVILPQTDLTGARIVAERIRIAFENLKFPQIDPELKLTVSIGIAQYHPKEGVAEVEQRADAALYSAKHKGRNRVETESWSIEKADAASTFSSSKRMST